MSDLIDTSNWRSDWENWRTTDEATAWRTASVGENSRKTVPIKAAIEYIKILSSDPEIVAAIKEQSEFEDGKIDVAYLPAEKSYGSIVSGLSEWFLWNKNLMVSVMSWRQQVERCVCAFSDRPVAEISDEEILNWMRAYNPPPSRIYEHFGRERPELFDYSEI